MEPFGGMQGSGLKTEIVQGLIHILDEQNELVQVFITARDKLNEENFPEFKIQLYNVGGAHKYQLPTSGTLGAIVIQPDPNSQTEYDIIIEYKDKQPKRINKLHTWLQYKVDIKKCQFKQEKEQIIDEYVLQIPIA
ncbi:hypothetical protein CTI12_AA586620 [Artemisia annua]|uniref:Uncharacterized protein n=1 Tax=Artemisia annua TaxID=35608 RepID=A0A2U1KM94_ARTAN|nr:hypothetical protein CTI12_AA586620 [Artemisia annua]